MCKAEVMISQKLRNCFEKDYLQYQQPWMYHPGFPPSLSPMIAPHHQSGPLGMTSYVPGHHPHTQNAPLQYPISGPSASLSPTISSRSSMISSGQVNPATSSAAGTSTQPSHHIHSVPQHPSGQGVYYSYNMPFMYSHGQMHSNIPALFNSGANTWNYNLYPTLQNIDNIKETVFVFIPNSVVGAIIGRGGSTIRDMMNSSGASIKVRIPVPNSQFHHL